MAMGTSESNGPLARPWFKKKRIVIPAALVVLAAISPKGGADTASNTAASAAATSARSALAPSTSATTTQSSPSAAPSSLTTANTAPRLVAAAPATTKAAPKVAVPRVVTVPTTDVCPKGDYSGSRTDGTCGSPPSPAVKSAYYPNCAAAKAAGVTPIYRGQPGYSRKLDRDGDGVACER